MAAFYLFLAGNFNKATLVIFSFIALGLVYLLALWSAFTNGQDDQTGSI